MSKPKRPSGRDAAKLQIFRAPSSRLFSGAKVGDHEGRPEHNQELTAPFFFRDGHAMTRSIPYADLFLDKRRPTIFDASMPAEQVPISRRTMGPCPRARAVVLCLLVSAAISGCRLHMEVSTLALDAATAPVIDQDAPAHRVA